MLRLSFQNKRVDKATGYYVDPVQWNKSRQRLKGNKDISHEINEWIDSIIVKMANIMRELEDDNLHLPSIIEKLFAKMVEEPTILKTIDSHVKELKERVGKDYTFSTYEKYVFTQNKVTAFIKAMNKKDILLRDITTKFIIEFDNYLRTNDNNKNNTAVKYCLNLKRILNVAVLKGLLPANPFNKYKTVYKDTSQIYLSEAEVGAIEQANLVKKQHTLSRDLFIFQCNTGLAYTDMISLNHNDISEDQNGKKWIIKERQKTGITSTIPLLPRAILILKKYQNYTRNSETLLPHYSIQKYNQYIAEIGKIAKISKKLSSHVGRRTFGNIALSKGVSLNVISKILGHSNTIITQRIYAITTQNIISQEIEKLE